MVVTALLNDFSKSIAQGIGDLFRNAGINGRSNVENDNEEQSGNIFTNIITRVLDSGSSGSGAGGGMQNTIKNLVLDNLTVENLNTFKGLLRAYWEQHKGHDEEEVRKDLDILQKEHGDKGMAGELSRVIKCVEYEMSDEDCGLGVRKGIDSLPEYDQEDDVFVRNANEAVTKIMRETSKLVKSSNMMGETNGMADNAGQTDPAESFAFDAKVMKVFIDEKTKSNSDSSDMNIS